MHNLENFIYGIAMAIVAVWIVKSFWGSFFEQKKATVLTTGIFAAYFLLQIHFQYNEENINTAVSIVNAILILLIAISGYESKGKTKYFLFVIFWTVWALLELLAFFILENVHVNMENPQILGEVVSKILMMVFVYILSVFWKTKKEQLIPNKFFLWLFVIPVGSVYIAICEFDGQTDRFSSILVISILLVFNVIIYELYIKLNEIFVREKDNTIYAQQLDIVAGNMLEQKRMMEEFHEEKHNLVNELIVLKDLIDNNNNQKAIENIDEIMNGCYSAEHICDSGNSTVDAIINFKYAVASEFGIKFRLKIFIPDEMPIEQKDLGVVLGNALDNAIEAVKNCREHEKNIEISMGVKKEAWVMVIKNPYEAEIKTDYQGEIITSKSDKNRHGYGLKSIKKIAEKYQGDTITDAINNFFSLTVILNFGEI